VAVTPPLRVNASPYRPVSVEVPQVQSYDETAYTCKAEDTYEKISREFYNGTPVYAEALRQYNKNHWLATGAMQQHGYVVAGETIYLPPAAVLERKHGAFIQRADGPGGGPAAVPSARIP
jgi:hypothetical protein